MHRIHLRLLEPYCGKGSNAEPAVLYKLQQRLLVQTASQRHRTLQYFRTLARVVLTGLDRARTSHTPLLLPGNKLMGSSINLMGSTLLASRATKRTCADFEYSHTCDSHTFFGLFISLGKFMATAVRHRALLLFECKSLSVGFLRRMKFDDEANEKLDLRIMTSRNADAGEKELCFLLGAC